MKKIGLDTIFRLSVIVNMVDQLTRPSAMVGESLDRTTEKILDFQRGAGNMAKTGLAFTTFGADATKALLSPVEATFATKKALGEMSAVGVEDLKALEKAATEFSDKWAGINKEQFIAAAYDIKGGIASLSDEGVAEYTKIAALTAKGTKASVDEMTSLFATGYGIYKDFYKDLNDIQFAEMFSAGIAQSVNIFKTEGSSMAQAIQALGASATTAQVPLEEQLTVLGMLQATMSGGEAGTKYKSFMQTAAKAGNELGLSFVDANNKLKSTPEILNTLKSKFGETMDAAEKMQIQKAFGSDEAMAMIDLLYGKVGAVTDNIKNMNGALGEGTKIAEDAAVKMNQDPGQRYVILQQQAHNLKEKIGNQLLPTVVSAMEKGNEIVGKVSSWVDKNQELVGTLGKIALYVLPVITIIGILLTTIGAMGIIFSKVALGVGTFRTAMLAVRGSIDTVRIASMYACDGLKAFGAFLMANPALIWIAAIAALVGIIIYLWNHNEKFRNAIISIWNSIKSFMGPVIENIKQFFAGLVEYIKNVPEYFNQFKNNVYNHLLNLKDKIVNVLNSIKVFFTNVFESIKNVVMAILQPFINGIMNIFGNMKVGISNIFEGLKTYFTGVWNAIKLIILGPVLLIIDLVTGDFSRLKTDAVKIFTGLQAAFGQIWSGIRQIFTGVIQAIVGYVVGAFQNLSGNIIKIWNTIKNFLSALWTGIGKLASVAWNGLKSSIVNIVTTLVENAINIFMRILNFYISLPQRLFTLGVNMFTGLKNGIGSILSGLGGFIIKGFDTAISFITGLPGKALGWGKDFIQGMINGITSMIGGITDAVKGVGDKIRSFLHFSVPDEGPLTDYETWMPDFMEGMANGIKVKAHVVTDKIGDLAFNMRDRMQLPNLNAIPQMVFAGGVSIPRAEVYEQENTNISSNFERERSFKKVDIKEIIREQKTEVEREVIKNSGKRLTIQKLELHVNNIKNMNDFQSQLENATNAYMEDDD